MQRRHHDRQFSSSESEDGFETCSEDDEQPEHWHVQPTGMSAPGGNLGLKAEQDVTTSSSMAGQSQQGSLCKTGSFTASSSMAGQSQLASEGSIKVRPLSTSGAMSGQSQPAAGVTSQADGTSQLSRSTLTRTVAAAGGTAPPMPAALRPIRSGVPGVALSAATESSVMRGGPVRSPTPASNAMTPLKPIMSPMRMFSTATMPVPPDMAAPVARPAANTPPSPQQSIGPPTPNSLPFLQQPIASLTPNTPPSPQQSIGPPTPNSLPFLQQPIASLTPNTPPSPQQSIGPPTPNSLPFLQQPIASLTPNTPPSPQQPIASLTPNTPPSPQQPIGPPTPNSLPFLQQPIASLTPNTPPSPQQSIGPPAPNTPEFFLHPPAPNTPEFFLHPPAPNTPPSFQQTIASLTPNTSPFFQQPTTISTPRHFQQRTASPTPNTPPISQQPPTPNTPPFSQQPPTQNTAPSFQQSIAPNAPPSFQQPSQAVALPSSPQTFSSFLAIPWPGYAEQTTVACSPPPQPSSLELVPCICELLTQTLDMCCSCLDDQPDSLVVGKKEAKMMILILSSSKLQKIQHEFGTRSFCECPAHGVMPAAVQRNTCSPCTDRIIGMNNSFNSAAVILDRISIAGSQAAMVSPTGAGVGREEDVGRGDGLPRSDDKDSQRGHEEDVQLGHEEGFRCVEEGVGHEGSADEVGPSHGQGVTSGHGEGFGYEERSASENGCEEERADRGAEGGITFGNFDSTGYESREICAGLDWQSACSVEAVHGGLNTLDTKSKNIASQATKQLLRIKKETEQSLQDLSENRASTSGGAEGGITVGDFGSTGYESRERCADLDGQPTGSVESGFGGLSTLDKESRKIASKASQKLLKIKKDVQQALQDLSEKRKRVEEKIDLMDASIEEADMLLRNHVTHVHTLLDQYHKREASSLRRCHKELLQGVLIMETEARNYEAMLVDVQMRASETLERIHQHGDVTAANDQHVTALKTQLLSCAALNPAMQVQQVKYCVEVPQVTSDDIQCLLGRVVVRNVGEGIDASQSGVVCGEPLQAHSGPPTVHQGPYDAARDSSAAHQKPSAARQHDPSGVHQGPSAVLQEPPAVHQTPPAVHQKPSAVLQEPSAVLQEPSAVHQKPPAVHQKPSAVHQKLSAVYQQPSALHQKPSAVHQNPSAVHHYNPPADNHEPSTGQSDSPTEHYSALRWPGFGSTDRLLESQASGAFASGSSGTTAHEKGESTQPSLGQVLTSAELESMMLRDSATQGQTRGESFTSGQHAGVWNGSLSWFLKSSNKAAAPKGGKSTRSPSLAGKDKHSETMASTQSLASSTCSSSGGSAKTRKRAEQKARQRAREEQKRAEEEALEAQEAQEARKPRKIINKKIGPPKKLKLPAKKEATGLGPTYNGELWVVYGDRDPNLDILDEDGKEVETKYIGGNAMGAVNFNNDSVLIYCISPRDLKLLGPELTTIWSYPLEITPRGVGVGNTGVAVAMSTAVLWIALNGEDNQWIVPKKGSTLKKLCSCDVVILQGREIVCVADSDGQKVCFYEKLESGSFACLPPFSGGKSNPIEPVSISAHAAGFLAVLDAGTSSVQIVDMVLNKTVSVIAKENLCWGRPTQIAFALSTGEKDPKLWVGSVSGHVFLVPLKFVY